MAGLEDVIRSSAAGSIAKPLMLGLLALLASGKLFGGSDEGQSTGREARPTSDGGSGDGDILGGLGSLLNKLQKGGLADAANSWVGSGPNQPVSPGQLGSALGPNIVKTIAERSGLPEEEITKQLSQVLPGVVDKLTPKGRMPTLAELSDMR